MQDDVQGPGSGRVFRLVYRSHDLIPRARRSAELGILFGTARSNNKRQNVCGALLVADDTFVQVLEGEESVVRALFERIAKDPRHSEVVLLAIDHVHAPVFSRWAMAEVAEDGTPDIPLIAHRDGISPAAPRRTTPEQELLLEHMRAAARDDSRIG